MAIRTVISRNLQRVNFSFAQWLIFVNSHYTTKPEIRLREPSVTAIRILCGGLPLATIALAL